MAKILGPENAAKKAAPYVASIPKLARIKHIILHRTVEKRLHKEIELRKQCRAIKYLSDAPGDSTLWKHQRVDLNYILATQLPSYLLAEEASVGKTFVGIDWAAKILRAKRTLVVCPGEVKEQWEDAIRARQPHAKIVVVQGRIEEQIKQISSTREGWVIGHWESLVHARIGYLQRAWDCVIADEAHLAQNRKAQRTQTLLDLQRTYGMAMSGNPWAGEVTEMFSILKFLYPNIYTSFWRFAAMHVVIVPGPFDNLEFDGVRRPKLLRWEIAPFTIRRTVAQVRPNMPQTGQRRRLASLTKKGQIEYRRLQKSLFAELDGFDEEKVLPILNALARTTRLRQYVIDPGLIGAREPSVKYPLVLQLLRELQAPLVIFSQYTQALMRLMDFLRKNDPKLNAGLIIGKRHHRHPLVPNAKARFLAGELDILGVSGKKGGLGLNLGKYGLVSMLDLPWNSRDFTQWVRRVDRPEEGTGKVVKTTNYRFVVRETYEVKMEKMIEETHYKFSEVFSVGQIRELFG